MSVTMAFGSIPKDGGTFTFYRNLRPALLTSDIDLRCVSVGKAEADLWNDAFADEGCVLIAPGETHVKKQAMAFSAWCEANGVDLVMGINSLPILSALPHLPEKIRVMARCANGFDHGYKITLSGAERLTAIIATTPRLKTDLVEQYGAEARLIHLIPNGIAPAPFQAASETPRGVAGPVRLGFLGRLEHQQKGVFFLPDILRHLEQTGVDFTFRIAGRGIHRKMLERQLTPYIADERVTLMGALPPSGVADFLSSVDVFVFTSQFEGCPNALLEATMAGCVPVVFQIAGITDFIVQDGVTGWVCTMADCEGFASRIAEISKQRDRLRNMAAAAAADARVRFSQTRVAADYTQLIAAVMQAPPPSWTPLPWSAFRPDLAFGSHKAWQVRFPTTLKRAIYNGLFHVGVSNRYYD